MPFTGIQLKPEEPFELALPAGRTFVLCQAALARPAKVGFTAAISVRCADGPETIICMLCKGREQWSCVGRPFTFDGHDKAIISVTGAIVDVLGQMVITAEDIDSPTKGEQSESDDGCSDESDDSDDFINEYEGDEEAELRSLPRSSAAKTEAVRAQVFKSFVKSGMSVTDAQHFVDTLPQCLIDAAQPVSAEGDEESDGSEESVESEDFT